MRVAGALARLRGHRVSIAEDTGRGARLRAVHGADARRPEALDETQQGEVLGQDGPRELVAGHAGAVGGAGEAGPGQREVAVGRRGALALPARCVAGEQRGYDDQRVVRLRHAQRREQHLDHLDAALLRAVHAADDERARVGRAREEERPDRQRRRHPPRWLGYLGRGDQHGADRARSGSPPTLDRAPVPLGDQAARPRRLGTVLEQHPGQPQVVRIDREARVEPLVHGRLARGSVRAQQIEDALPVARVAPDLLDARGERRGGAGRGSGRLTDTRLAMQRRRWRC